MELVTVSLAAISASCPALPHHDGLFALELKATTNPRRQQQKSDQKKMFSGAQPDTLQDLGGTGAFSMVKHGKPELCSLRSLVDLV